MGFWPDIPEGLNREGFREIIEETLAMFDTEWVLEARSDERPRPVGIAVGKFLNNGERVLEPHVEWFPWATPRNRLEASAQFMREVGKKYKILVFTRDSEAPLYERLKQYRILKKGSRINGYFSSDESAQLYYTAGP